MSIRQMKIVSISDTKAVSGRMVTVIKCGDDELTQLIAFFPRGMDHPSMVGKMVNVRYYNKFIMVGGSYGLSTPFIIGVCKEGKY